MYTPRSEFYWTCWTAGTAPAVPGTCALSCINDPPRRLLQTPTPGGCFKQRITLVQWLFMVPYDIWFGLTSRLYQQWPLQVTWLMDRNPGPEESPYSFQMIPVGSPMWRNHRRSTSNLTVYIPTHWAQHSSSTWNHIPTCNQYFPVWKNKYW